MCFNWFCTGHFFHHFKSFQEIHEFIALRVDTPKRFKCIVREKFFLTFLGYSLSLYLFRLLGLKEIVFQSDFSKRLRESENAR